MSHISQKDSTQSHQPVQHHLHTRTTHLDNIVRRPDCYAVAIWMKSYHIHKPDGTWREKGGKEGGKEGRKEQERERKGGKRVS